jgi:hypothetical protein
LPRVLFAMMELLILIAELSLDAQIKYSPPLLPLVEVLI